MSATLQRAFEMMLEAGFSATILALIIAAVQWALRGRLSPAWRFALWTPVLLRLFLPIFPESPVSLFNAPRWYAHFKGDEFRPVTVFWLAEERPATVSFGGASLDSPASVRELHAAPPTTEADNGVAGVTYEATPGPSGFAPLGSATLSALWTDFRSIAAAVWLCGVMVLLGRLAIGSSWITQRLRRESHATPPILEEIMRDAARAGQFRITPRLRETKSIDSPALFGLWRPVLLLPAGFSERLGEREIRHVFLHELAHLKRRDLWVNWAMAIAQAVHWFNPVAWLVFRRMRLERELACDEMALRACDGSDPKAYGETILRLLEGVSTRPALSALVGIAEEKHSATKRLQQIAAFRAGKCRYWIAVPVLVALVLVGLTNAQAPRNGDAAPESQETQDQNSPEETTERSNFHKDEAVIRFDVLQLEGKTLTEAVKILRTEFPDDFKDVRFAWFQSTNLNFDATEIGKVPTPADEVRLSRQALSRSSNLDQLGPLTFGPDADLERGGQVSAALELIVRGLEKRVLCIIHKNTVTFNPEGFQPGGGIMSVFPRDPGLLGNPLKDKPSGRFDWYSGNVLIAKDIASLTDADRTNRDNRAVSEGLTLKAGDPYRQLMGASLFDWNQVEPSSPLKAVPTSVEEKLAEARIERIDLEGLTLTKALERLREELPAELQDIRFRWFQTTNMSSGRLPDGGEKIESRVNEGAVYAVNAIGYIESDIGSRATPADEIRLSQKRLQEATSPNMPSLRLRNFRARAVLDLIAQAAEKPIRYSVQQNTVLFSFVEKPQDKIVKLVMDSRLLLEMGKPAEAKAKLEEALKIDPEHRAARYYFTLAEEQIRARAAREREEGVEPSPAPPLRDPTSDQSAPASKPIGFDWYNNPGGGPPPNPYARTNRVYTSAGRQKIVKKLNEVVLPIYEVDDASLTDVVKDLAVIARKQDPERTGVNFIISREEPEIAAGGERLPMVSDFRLRIHPPLRNVRLIDVLDAITRVAMSPPTAGPRLNLKYSIEDYAVVFSYRTNETEPLYTRTFRLDPNSFQHGLDAVYSRGGIIGVTVTNSPADIQEAVRNFFAAAGVVFPTNQIQTPGDGRPSPPQKAIFFNDRTGVLFVRATLRELDIVEKALQALNMAPPQVQIRTEQVALKDREDLDVMMQALKKIQGEFRPVLTDLEFRRLKEDTGKGDRFFVRLQNVATVSARPALVSLDEHAVDVRPVYDERNNSFRIEARSFDLNAKDKTVTRRGRIYDGQTFVVLPASEGAESPGYITFITADLIDPAGNLVRDRGEGEVSAEQTPPQDEKY